MTSFALEPVALAICAVAGYAFGGGIGQGTFKETYLVTKPDGTPLALKVIKSGCSPTRSDREVEAMKRCNHPNIMALIELATFDHRGTKFDYLIEAYMGGGTLDDRLKRGALNRDEILDLGEELIRAVGHIAEQNLVHRDLKPANIMYAKAGGEAVVGDFGIVRDLTKPSLTTSHLAVGPGTPLFASPEQLNNEKALIDWRTDQFSIGVTLTMAHFGFHPYQRQGESPNQAIGLAAARTGPSEQFSKSVEAAKLPVLAKMVAPWPVQRVRTPDALFHEWRGQVQVD